MAKIDVVSEPKFDRLSSWKEIAAFFDKDVRTVRRWEAERSLPVHRLPGGPRASVFAYASELDHWLRQRENVPANEVLPDVQQEERTSRPVAPENDMPAPPAGLSSRSRWGIFGATGLLALLLLLAVPALERPLRSSEAAAREPAARTVHAEGSENLGRESTNPAAQDLYLRGRYLWNQRTEASLHQAVDMFTQAIVLDQNFAAGYAGLADCYILLRQYGHETDAAAFPRALVASERALSLDPASSEAHRTHAFLLNYWVWDFPAAEKEFLTAIQLNPNEPQSHHWFATALYSNGHFEEAIREIDLARRLQPDSIAIMANRGLLLAATNQDAALKYLQEVEAMNPHFAPVHAHLAIIYMNRGNAAAYLRESEQAATLSADLKRLAILQEAQQALTRDGYHAMLALLAAGFGQLALQDHRDAMTPAYLYTRLQQNDTALRFIRLACDQREAAFLRISNDPLFRPLYDLSEFKALLIRRNQPLTAEARS